MLAEEPETVHGEPSFALANEQVALYLTPRGGHLGPARFNIPGRWVQPYALAPWLPGAIDPQLPPILQVLRGDFFCLPFGGGRRIGAVHGETANATWQLVAREAGRLVLELKGQHPVCTVRKSVGIRPGERAIYLEHRIEGLQGRFNFGHHAILQFPATGGPYHVNTSPFHFGQVKPEAFSSPLLREYGALKTGARFRSLAKVALANGGYTDLSRYPARQGFEDLILLASKPGNFAWTAATLDGYVWISLKDPRLLPSTLFWMSNGGRHAPPWNGAHLGRLGLEEVCGHFSDGLEVSRRDLLRRHKVPTTRAFRANQSTSIRVIHLVHPVPRNFGKLMSVERQSDGLRISGERGRALRVPVRQTFLDGMDWRLFLNGP